MMKIYSGSCCLCNVGIPTGETDGPEKWVDNRRY